MRGVVEKRQKRGRRKLFCIFLPAFFKEVASLSVASHVCKLLSLASKITLKVRNMKKGSAVRRSGGRGEQEFLFSTVEREEARKPAREVPAEPHKFESRLRHATHLDRLFRVC